MEVITKEKFRVLAEKMLRERIEVEGVVQRERRDKENTYSQLNILQYQITNPENNTQPS